MPSPKRSRPFYTKNRCQSLLKKKIGINMTEYNAGMFVSRPQAIAVSYSQVRKSYPGCSKFIGTKSPSEKRSRKVSKKRSRKVSKKVSKKRSRKVSKKSYRFMY
jgi:hypothetical protein